VEPGHHDTQWDSQPRWLLAPVILAGVAALALLIGGYRYGIPAVARLAAERVPDELVDTLGQAMFRALDEDVFKPTALPRARRDQLLDGFGRLVHPNGRRTAAFQVLFRRSDDVGANAMALPSGVIVVTDALVELSESDAANGDHEVLAVLAHEAGHVERRHGLRLVFQNSLVGMALAWLVGDPGSLLAAAPAVLLQAKYSRDLEREADMYAVAVLDASGIERKHFARILERLEHAQPGGSSTSGGGVAGYLATHPVTAERLTALRQP
jgi:predicted Zn-dependent protease